MTVKENLQESEIQCPICEKKCMNEKGLNIHKGKVHTASPSLKRTRSEFELCKDGDMCDTCGNDRRLTPANPKAMRKTTQVKDSHKINLNATTASCTTEPTSSQSPKNKIINETSDTLLNKKKLFTPSEQKDTCEMDIDNKDNCDQCEYINIDKYAMKQHKRDAHRNIFASVTPPPKKQRDIEKEGEVEFEKVIKQIEELQVVEENYISIKEEDKIPARLTKMLEFKGLDIKDNRVRRVGGGGKCGANCVSTHTTGMEEQSTEIRINANRHIIEN